MSQAESRRGQAPCQLFLAVRRQELVLDGGVAGQALSVHAPLAGITAPTGGDRAAMDGAVAREALQSLLRTEGLPRHATLHVVFEQPCLLHMTVPWSPQLLKADQAGSYVRRCAVESGWDLGRWQLQVDDAGFGQPRLAIAYPVAWLEALQAFTKAQGWQMGRVTGLSVLAWQEARRQSKAVRQLVLAGGQAPLFLAGDSRLESVHALSAPQAAREEDLLRLWQRLRWRQPAWTDGEPVLHGLHAENPEPADQPSEPA
ncbi:MAG TPA: hypothetical protein VK195_11575, partial [Burkholderiaceae bacterium]|nr:hypothetical protein [Burkholderiaceae bacterium]